MIRKLFESALCILLAPLLVAQQAAQPLEPQATAPIAIGTATARSPSSSDLGRLTNATQIDLVVLDPISSKTATVGTQIRFHVLRDMSVQNTPIIRAGALVTGTVKKVTVASKRRHRDGQIKVRLYSYKTGTGQTIRFTGVSPEGRLERKENRKEALKLLPLLPLIVPMVPYMALMAIGMWNEGGTPSGDDLELSACVHVKAYTVGTIEILPGDLVVPKGGSDEATSDACPTYWEPHPSETARFKIE
jgi:hypothetical protein